LGDLRIFSEQVFVFLLVVDGSLYLISFRAADVIVPFDVTPIERRYNFVSEFDLLFSEHFFDLFEFVNVCAHSLPKAFLSFHGQQ
jgi:hypothetical protein